jgi:hypothetical protein
VSMNGDYRGKIFNTDLRVAGATMIQWLLSGLTSRVTVTLFSSLGADLLHCQRQYIRDRRYGKQSMKQSLYIHNLTTQ